MKFPLGEISLEEKDEEEEEQKRTLSVNGIVRSQMLDGLYTARFSEETLNLRYAYKVISFRVVSKGFIFISFFHFVKEFIVTCTECKYFITFKIFTGNRISPKISICSGSIKDVQFSVMYNHSFPA